MDQGQKKCFLEQMPKNTVFLGNYNATLTPAPGPAGGSKSNPNSNSNNIGALRIQVTVECNGDMVMSQQLGPVGRFFFTSTLAADHLVCIQTVRDSNSNWMSSTPDRIKMQLEVFIGDPGETTIISPVKQKLDGLAGKLATMNALLAELRRDQYNHRTREAEFRDKSDEINSNINYWMMLQIASLIGSCIWQMNHLRGFFRSNKLI